MAVIFLKRDSMLRSGYIVILPLLSIYVKALDSRPVLSVLLIFAHSLSPFCYIMYVSDSIIALISELNCELPLRRRSFEECM